MENITMEIKKGTDYFDILKEILHNSYTNEEEELVVRHTKIDLGKSVLVVEMSGARQETDDVKVSIVPVRIAGITFTDVRIRADYLAGFGLIKRKIDTTIRVSETIKKLEAKLKDGLLIIEYDYYENETKIDLK